MSTAVSPIMNALYHGQRDEAEHLAAELGSEKLTLHEAAALGAMPRLTQLVFQRPELINAWSSDGFQPLQLAAFFGHPEAASLLLAHGGDVMSAAQNSFKITALHAALAGPVPDIARSLIEAGADVNATQQDGVTPLHEAAANGQLALVQLLLEHGADRTARDGQGRSAADHARAHNHASIVDLLEA